MFASFALQRYEKIVEMPNFFVFKDALASVFIIFWIMSFLQP